MHVIGVLIGLMYLLVGASFFRTCILEEVTLGRLSAGFGFVLGGCLVLLYTIWVKLNERY
jgi:hypothetical protein